jgi:hypothetical protein
MLRGSVTANVLVRLALDDPPIGTMSFRCQETVWGLVSAPESYHLLHVVLVIAIMLCAASSVTIPTASPASGACSAYAPLV